MKKTELEVLTKRLIEIRPLKDDNVDEYKQIIQEIYNDGIDFFVFPNLLQGLIDESVDFNRSVVEDLIYLMESFDVSGYIYVKTLLEHSNYLMPHAKEILTYQLYGITNRADTRQAFIEIMNGQILDKSIHQNIKEILVAESQMVKPKNKFIDEVARMIE